MYAGRCQLCLWDPRAAYGDSIYEAHHIVWLSRGGEDALGNLVVLESESSPGGASDG